MLLYKRDGELTSELIASGLELIAKCTSSYEAKETTARGIESHNSQ